MNYAGYGGSYGYGGYDTQGYGYGYGYGETCYPTRYGYGNNYALILVLFILLVIIGASFNG